MSICCHDLKFKTVSKSEFLNCIHRIFILFYWFSHTLCRRIFKRELSRASTFNLFFLVTFFQNLFIFTIGLNFQEFILIILVIFDCFGHFWWFLNFLATTWSRSVFARACRLEVFSVLFLVIFGNGILKSNFRFQFWRFEIFIPILLILLTWWLF